MGLFAIRKFMGPQENRLPAGSREEATDAGSTENLCHSGWIDRPSPSIRTDGRTGPEIQLSGRGSSCKQPLQRAGAIVDGIYLAW